MSRQEFASCSISSSSIESEIEERKSLRASKIATLTLDAATSGGTKVNESERSMGGATHFATASSFFSAVGDRSRTTPMSLRVHSTSRASLSTCTRQSLRMPREERGHISDDWLLIIVRSLQQHVEISTHVSRSAPPDTCINLYP
jgi:hypothetical protein